MVTALAPEGGYNEIGSVYLTSGGVNIPNPPRYLTSGSHPIYIQISWFGSLARRPQFEFDFLNLAVLCPTPSQPQSARGGWSVSVIKMTTL